MSRASSPDLFIRAAYTLVDDSYGFESFDFTQANLTAQLLVKGWRSWMNEVFSLEVPSRGGVADLHVHADGGWHGLLILLYPWDPHTAQEERERQLSTLLFRLNPQVEERYRPTFAVRVDPNEDGGMNMTVLLAEMNMLHICNTHRLRKGMRQLGGGQNVLTRGDSPQAELGRKLWGAV